MPYQIDRTGRFVAREHRGRLAAVEEAINRTVGVPSDTCGDPVLLNIQPFERVDIPFLVQTKDPQFNKAG